MNQHQIELVLMSKNILYQMNNGRNLCLEPIFIKNLLIEVQNTKKTLGPQQAFEKSLFFMLQNYFKNINMSELRVYYDYLFTRFFSSSSWKERMKKLGLM